MAIVWGKPADSPHGDISQSRQSREHTTLILGCPYVKPIINGIGQRLSGRRDTALEKMEFIGGLEDISLQNMRVTVLLVHFIKYQIYNSRCRHKLPTVPQIMYELEGLSIIYHKGNCGENLWKNYRSFCQEWYTNESNNGMEVVSVIIIISILSVHPTHDFLNMVTICNTSYK